MYIPKINQMPDRAQQLEFIRQYSFATVVNVEDGVPVATHIPVILQEKGPEIWLTSHLARANPQWKTFATSETLIIFQEPHAYISPRNYLRKENVPTWNYLAVHAYGAATIVSKEKAIRQVLESMMQTYEPEYLEQWKGLSEEYKTGMMQGIVTFEMKVDRLEAKEKLSQNKKPREVANIINDLQQSPHSTEQQIADLMQKKFK